MAEKAASAALAHFLNMLSFFTITIYLPFRRRKEVESNFCNKKRGITHMLASWSVTCSRLLTRIKA